MSILKTNAIQTVAGKPLVNTTGNIINVYQNIDTTQRYYQDGLVDNNLTTLAITLTPTSTNSKFILVANILVSMNYVIGFGFKRNGTVKAKLVRGKGDWFKSIQKVKEDIPKS